MRKGCAKKRILLFHLIQFVLEGDEGVVGIARAAGFRPLRAADGRCVGALVAQDVVPTDFEGSAVVAQELILCMHVPDDVGAVGIGCSVACSSIDFQIGCQREAVGGPVIHFRPEVVTVYAVSFGSIRAFVPLVSVKSVDRHVVLLSVDDEPWRHVDAVVIVIADDVFVRIGGALITNSVIVVMTDVDADVCVLEVCAV